MAFSLGIGKEAKEGNLDGRKGPHETGESEFLAELRNRIERWLDGSDQKQSTLAADCGVAAADLAHFLKGQRSLPTYGLANLAANLGMDPARLLLRWDYCQYARKAEEGAASHAPPSAKTTGWERARDSLDALLRRLPSDGATHEPVRHPATLGDWPLAFLPIVVFVGDRRETPPQTPADLLAVPASMGDLYYLPRLQLPPETEIRSDKACVIASPETLRTLLQDKNLLIIGSPAANLMARAVNRGACFSFHVTTVALEQATDFQKILEPIRYLPGDLKGYEDERAATPAQMEWLRRRRHMIYGFARSGILDPVDYEGLRAERTPAYRDYGVVSLCRHPWSEKHVAIMAAGLHGPATAAAIKLLSQPNAFADRPLGGVFSVHVPIDAPWAERYHHLNPEWDTHEYSFDTYAKAVKEFTETRQKELEGHLKFWNPGDVGALLRLVTS